MPYLRGSSGDLRVHGSRPRSLVVALQENVHQRMRHGGSIDDVDTEIIEPSPLDADQKAALWLYAWSCMPRRMQRRSAQSMLEGLAVLGD
jgi:hypothetical protein